MSALLRRALGADFDRLHPMLRERYAISPEDGVAVLGHGYLDEIWHRSRLAVPFLGLGPSRDLFRPEAGTRVRFSLHIRAYRDADGRDALGFTHVFEPRPRLRRQLKATMVESGSGAIVEMFGDRQHLAADLHPYADHHGGLWIRTGRQRLGRYPLPRALSGTGRIHEWWDERRECFGIEVRVTNRYLGPLFGYRGRFTARFVDEGAVPVPGGGGRRQFAV